MPGALGVNLRDTAQMNRVLHSEEARSVLPPNMALLYLNKPVESNGQQFLRLVAVKKDRTGSIAAPIGGEVVSDARQDYDPR
jgi:SecD/SecF fusion protein